MFSSLYKAPILNMNSMLSHTCSGSQEYCLRAVKARITVAKGSHLILPHQVRFSKAIFALTLD